ncbi:hypothetical protein I4U23_023391 [Adineta vaga]|nr:hypothetical protein I4U23_023391 [Adineta vaga]
MGCIFGCYKCNLCCCRSERRIEPHISFCLICRCSQYIKHKRGSNQCDCGHSPGEHKRI